MSKNMPKRSGLQATIADFAGRMVGREPVPDVENKLPGSDILDKLTHSLGVEPQLASRRDWLSATSLAVRDHALDHWQASIRESQLSGGKEVCYLSMEFLIGRILRDAAGNLGLTSSLQASLKELGIGSLNSLADLEADPALGNGGLGRLAACYMESMASVGIPAWGYGIRYDYGLFRQRIEDGKQVLHAVRISASVEFVRVLYTAILAPFVLFVLGRIRGVFAFQPGRTKSRQWSR